MPQHTTAQLNSTWRQVTYIVAMPAPACFTCAQLEGSLKREGSDDGRITPSG